VSRDFRVWVFFSSQEPRWSHVQDGFKLTEIFDFKGTVSPDYKCLEVVLIKSPLLGHVTLDTKNLFTLPFNF
jgi:hypothetical protein